MTGPFDRFGFSLVLTLIGPGRARGWSSRDNPNLRAFLVALALSVGLFAPPARAGTVLDRVKAMHVIRCGAVERPGLLESESGHFGGLFVDLCKAVGTAAAGPDVRVEVDTYDAEASYDAVRSGGDDLFFLTGSEIAEHRLAGLVVPGPPAFMESTAVMVAERSTLRTLADLAGQPLCFLQGTNAHRNLEAWAAAGPSSFIRMGYQEELELYDAFDAQVCHGLAAEMTTLADIRRDGGPNRRTARILPEPLATFPILAATGVSDGSWSSLVAWTVSALLDADRPKSGWAAGGPDSLPVEAPELGLTAGWIQRLVASTGSYAALYDRNLGPGSPLALPPGPNALTGGGGLFVPPYAE